MTDRPEHPERPVPDAEDADVPEILEVFGAAPLVDPSVETEESVALDEAPAEIAESTPTSESSDPEVVGRNAEPEAPQAAAPTEEQALAPSAGSEPPLAELQGFVLLMEQRMGSIEETLAGLAKQSSFLPPKLRGLGKKVDDLASILADSRLRETMLELVGLTDLIDAGLAPKAKKDDLKRTLQAVSTRLRQSMEGRGLMPIETDGAFDPARHQALERRVVHDPELDGQVVEVFRRGWRDAHAVLRYADVAVGAYEEPRAQPEPPAADDVPTPSAETPQPDELPSPVTEHDADPGEGPAAITPATLTPAQATGRAAPRRDTDLDPSIAAGVTDRTAAGTSSRIRIDNDEMDDV